MKYLRNHLTRLLPFTNCNELLKSYSTQLIYHKALNYFEVLNLDLVYF